MIYPEFLRVRRVITWGVIVFSCLLLLQLISVVFSKFWPEHVHVGVSLDSHETLPFSSMLVGIGFLVAGFVTLIGADLSRYTNHAELVMTLPLSRVRFALSVLALDAAGIVVAFLVGVLMIAVIPFTIENLWPHVVFDSAIPARAAMSFAAVLLWYSIICAVSAWFPGAAGAVAGLSWPVFGILSIKVENPGWLAVIFHVLRYINPMHYLQSSAALVHGPAALTIGFVLAAALVFCAVAVAGWYRQEI